MLSYIAPAGYWEISPRWIPEEISWTSQAAKPSAPCVTISRNDKTAVVTLLRVAAAFSMPEMLKMSVCNKKVAERFGSLQQMCYICTIQ